MHCTCHHTYATWYTRLKPKMTTVTGSPPQRTIEPMFHFRCLMCFKDSHMWCLALLLSVWLGLSYSDCCHRTSTPPADGGKHGWLWAILMRQGLGSVCMCFAESNEKKQHHVSLLKTMSLWKVGWGSKVYSKHVIGATNIFPYLVLDGPRRLQPTR